MGNRYAVIIEVDDKKLNEILQRLEKAKDEIYACYGELREMEVVKIEKKLACDDTHQQ